MDFIRNILKVLFSPAVSIEIVICNSTQLLKSGISCFSIFLLVKLVSVRMLVNLLF